MRTRDWCTHARGTRYAQTPRTNERNEPVRGAPEFSADKRAIIYEMYTTCAKSVAAIPRMLHLAYQFFVRGQVASERRIPGSSQCGEFVLQVGQVEYQEATDKISSQVQEFGGSLSTDDSERHGVEWHIMMMGVWDSVTSLPVLKFLAGRVLDNKKAEGSAELDKDALTEMGLSEDDLSNVTTDNASPACAEALKVLGPQVERKMGTQTGCDTHREQACPHRFWCGLREIRKVWVT